MCLKARVILGVALCLLGLVPPLVLAAEQASPPLPTVRLVAVEGASTTYHLIDYDKQIVTAVVPSQSSADIQRSNPDGTVNATLASVDGVTNRVKAVTQEGQVLVLDMAREALARMQLGDTFTLVMPRHAEVMAHR